MLVFVFGFVSGWVLDFVVIVWCGCFWWVVVGWLVIVLVLLMVVLVVV